MQDHPPTRTAEATRGAAARPRRVLLAGPRSFCAGVERAIEIVERTLDRYGPPVYVRRHIVHNNHVVRRLQGLGAVFVRELDEVPCGATVVFSAHGVGPTVRAEAARRRLTAVDATCPLVAKVHSRARRFVRDGRAVVFVGRAGHEEAEGAMDQAPDGFRLVETAEDAERLEVDDPARLAFLTQTTLATDETAAVVTVLRERFPLIEGPPRGDICYATSNRQAAVRALARQADLVLVVGSSHSSNSRRLVEVAEREGCPARLIEDHTRLDPAWLTGVGTVGLSAGASAPPEQVDGVVEALARLGEIEVEERHVVTETVAFRLPAAVG
jgi:4-hydroxy-3-methylbut-2-enyl diphosphate reductase